MATITVLLRPGKNAKENDEAMVYIRISHGNKHFYKSLGIKSYPAKFNPKPVNLAYCTGNGSPEKNVIIRDEYERIEKQILQLQASKTLNATTIKEAVMNSRVSDNSFVSIAQQYNESPRLSEGTARRYRYYAKDIMRPNFGSMSITEVTPKKLHEIEAIGYKKGNSANTVRGFMTWVKAVVNFAINKMGIDIPYPFGNRPGLYKMPVYKNPQRNYLTTEQVHAIDVLMNVTPDKQIRNTCKWFLFGCYSGMRYSDLAKFDKTKFVKGGKLYFSDVKTKNPHFIPIAGKLQGYLDGVDGLPIYTNEALNRYLKQIAGILKFPFPVTMHTARHTFAIRYLEAGGTLEDLSKLLGHTTMKTTMIYGKITSNRIIKNATDVMGRM